MNSKVYFVDFISRNPDESKINKIDKLFEAAGFAQLIKEDDLVAIKIHFGEQGNDSYINPVFIRPLVEKIKQNNAKPFLTDTNTLYYGSRHDSPTHLETAIKHGFNFSVVDAPVIIADGIKGDNWDHVSVNLKHFEKVKIASDILNLDSMLVTSHFKGHGMSGFGGAIKNLAMGCAAVQGKLEQHECAKPVISTNCSGCGNCVETCPVSAISLDDQARINYETCIACNNCIEQCPESCIDLEWEKMIPFIEKMVEYAFGAVKNKQDRIGYINFLMNITPDCDCVSWSDRAFVPDIGILASTDPVAIDEASYDLVNKQVGHKDSILARNHEPGDDKFRGLWENVDGRLQTKYAEEIGLGTRNYELIVI